MQINASAIISFKLFSLSVVVVVANVVLVALAWIRLVELVTTAPWSESSSQIHSSFLLTIASLHGLEAKPNHRPTHLINNSHHSIHPIHRRSTQSIKQKQDNKKKCKEIPIGVLFVFDQLINFDAGSVWFYYQQEESTEPASIEDVDDRFGCAQWQSISNSVQIRAANPYNARRHVVIFYIFCL